MSSPLGINPQPITKRGIQEHNPQIHCIYTGKKGVMPTYRALKPKEGGTALGTIYEIVRATLTPPRPPSASEWIGKIGRPTGRLRDDPNTIRTRTKKDINLDAIREKLGYDLYQELGRGIFHVPKTRLSLQSVMNDFTLGDSLAWDLSRFGISDSLRIMSRYIEGYQDLHHATIRVEGLDDPLDFITYLHNFHRPPTSIVTPAGKEVPLEGIMGLLAVGRVLGDTDIIGGSGGNAGFVWIKNEAGEVIAAQVYKIDPGECFNFKLEEPDQKGRLSFSKNWLVNTRATKAKLEIGGGGRLEDERDLQIAQSDSRVTLEWKFLSSEQKDEFLSTLFNCSRYLRADDILKYLFYRDSKFNRSPFEQIPEQVAQALQKELQEWLQLQLEVYHQELQEFKSRYPEHILRTEYIDRWGELPLPASDQTFPIRELFTQLTLIETHSETSAAKFSPSELPERDSLLETQEMMNLSSPILSLETLFDQREKSSAPRKVLLLGRAGIGKSTLCQKIAHDWASGRLWSTRYKAIYWLPLRELNQEVEQGGCLFHVKDPDIFLAKAVAYLRLKDQELAPSLHLQLQNHRQENLILLDGWDEASPLLVQSLEPLLRHPEFLLLLTSRPGVTEPLHQYMDLLVENMGFSNEQIAQYVHHFFSRGETQTAVAQSKKEKFLATLQKERNLNTVAHIPLILQMLCVQWERGAESKGFATTLPGLYSDMTEEFFRWQCRKEGADPYAISGQEKKEIFSVLGEVALEGLRLGKLILPGQLVQTFLQKTKISEKELLRTGLLRATGEGLTREYCFLHLTFQEYVIALSTTQKSPQEQKTFIVEHRSKPQFQLVLSLMAGIIDSQDPTKEKLTRFFDYLHTPPGDLTGFYQLALTLRCLQQCTDSVIQDWIEEKYRVYSTLHRHVQFEDGKSNSRLLNFIDYLKGSEKVVEQISQILFNEALNNRYWIEEDHLIRIWINLWKKTPPSRRFDLFTFLRQAVKHPKLANPAMGILINLCLYSPPEAWSELLSIVCQVLGSSQSIPLPLAPKSLQIRKASKALDNLCKTVPPEISLLETLQQALKDENIRSSLQDSLERRAFDDVTKLSEEERLLLSICRAHESRQEAQSGSDPLPGLQKKLPPPKKWTCFPWGWDEVFEISGNILKHPESNIRRIGVELLLALSKIAASGKMIELFGIVCQAIQAPDKNVAKTAAKALVRLCWNYPNGMKTSLYQVASQASKDADKDIQNEALEVLMILSSEGGSDVDEYPWWRINSGKDLVSVRTAFPLYKQMLPNRPNCFKSCQDALNDSDEEIRKTAAEILVRLCEIASFKRWIELFEGSYQPVKSITKRISDEGSEALAILEEKEIPEWGKLFGAVCPALRNPNVWVKRSAVRALARLCEHTTPDRWIELFEISCQTIQDPSLYNIDFPLTILCETVSPDSIFDVFERMSPIFKKPIYNGCIRIKMFVKLCGNISPVEWLELLEIFHKACETIKDEDPNSIENALEKVCQTPPFGKWLSFFEIVFSILKIPKKCYSRQDIHYLNILCTEAIPERWRALFEILCHAYKNLNPEVQSPIAGTLVVTLCQTIPSNQWLQGVEVLCQVFDDLDVEDQCRAVSVLGKLVAEAPSNWWQEVLENSPKALQWNELVQAGAKFIENPDEESTSQFLAAAENYSKLSPSSGWWSTFFITFTQAFEAKTYEDLRKLTEQFGELEQKAPNVFWRGVIQAILEDYEVSFYEWRKRIESWKPIVGKNSLVFVTLNEKLVKEHPEDTGDIDFELFSEFILEGLFKKPRWIALFKVIDKVFRDHPNVRKSARRALKELCEKAPPAQLLVLQQVLRQATDDPEEGVRHEGVVMMGILCKKVPSEHLPALFEILCDAIHDTHSVQKAAASALLFFPLSHFTQNLQYTAEYLIIFFDQLILRKSPLYIKRISDHQYQLTCVENNQEITKLISADEFAQMKQILLADHVLKSYVSRYIDQAASFNLEPILLWLRQKVPGNWQAKEGEDLALENPQGDPRLLSRAVREFVILADDLEINLQVIKHEKSLAIKGEPQDLEKLLEHLKTSSTQGKT